MPGEIHTLQREPHTPAHLQDHDAEGEGDAQLAIQYVVQKGIPGIVVGFPVPPEAMSLIENVQKLLEDQKRSGLIVEAIPGFFCQKVQDAQVPFLGKLRIFLPGHHEGCPSQIDFLVRARHLGR
jgi:hypothetical protein